jgi:hypothetical protein
MGEFLPAALTIGFFGAASGDFGQAGYIQFRETASVREIRLDFSGFSR